MDVPKEVTEAAIAKSAAPRKPRPSEIAAALARKAKAAKKRKPAPKAKKKNAKAGVRKGAKKVLKARAAARKPKAKKPAAGGNIIRTERLDFRLSKKEKAKLFKAAKAQKRTITGVIQILIEKLP